LTEERFLHIALLSHEYPPFIYGGVGIFVQNLATGLSKRGLKITIISGYPASHKGCTYVKLEKEKGAEINVIRFPYPNIPPRHVFFQLLNLKKLYKIIKKIDIDVIHGQSGSTFPAILNLKSIAPIVVTFHGNPKMQKLLAIYSLLRGGSFRDFSTYFLGYPIWAYSYKKEFMMSDATVAVSRTLMEEMRRNFGEKNNGNFLYIYNGVDIEKLQSTRANFSCDEEEENHTIIFGGRLFWAKGVIHLLKLAYLLKKEDNFRWKIIIYGTGPLSKKIRKILRDYNLNNVVVRGFVKREEFLNAIKKSTFVIVPSLDEACPTVLLESMCLGKIPIMFDLPFAREFTCNGKYGILAKSVEDMAKKIEMIHKNTDISILGKEIQRYARKKYDVNKMAQEYHYLYKKIEK
jgi:glycosyltransferase involved in cell wall biosynthesis